MQNFALQLQTNRQALSAKEQTLGDYLLAHQLDASTWSISTLSQNAGVSTATVSRFAKNLGYANFQALRLALSQPQAKHRLFEEIQPDDSLITMADKVFAANVDALNALMHKRLRKLSIY